MPLKVIVSTVCILMVGVLFVPLLYAGIGVAPTIVELRIKEGSEEKGTWTVTNSSDKPAIVNVDIENWLKANGSKDPSHWLKVEPSRLILGPNERKQIGYSVKLPKGLDGEVMAMVFFTGSDLEGPSSFVKPRFGVALYAINKGTEQLSADIKDITLLRHITKKGTEGIRIDVKVRNNGNVHIRPRVEFAIKDKSGRQLHSKEFPYGWPVLPNGSRGYSTFMEDVKLKTGKYKGIVNIKFGNLYEREEMLSKEIDFSVDKKGSIKIE